MAEKLDSLRIKEAILEKRRGVESVADRWAKVEDRTTDMLQDIKDGVDELIEGQRHDHSPCGGGGSSGSNGGSDRDDVVVGEIADALADGLSHVTSAPVIDPANRAAMKIRRFMRDNDSTATESDVAKAIRSIDTDGMSTTKEYADAVYRAVSHRVLEPGRNLPHQMGALDEAFAILVSVGEAGSDRRFDKGGGGGGGGGGGFAGFAYGIPGVGTGPPALASTEVLRDVSHLTTLLLGSSPAFAEAMRMQSDALAHSLASLNKVSDTQRQDALGLAITARVAADELNRR